MKTKMILTGIKMFLVFAMMTSLARSEFVQSPDDLLAPDTIMLEFVKTPDASQNDLTAIVKLYAFIDGNEVGVLSCGFRWQNPYMTLDSAVASPMTLIALDYGQWFYHRFSIDSTNYYRQFLFAGVKKYLPRILPSTERQHLATYYFSVSQWSEQDSLIIDTGSFNNGSIFEMGTPQFHVYKPCAIPRIVGYNQIASCCTGMRGNADCSANDIPSVSDISRIIDFLYGSGDPLCCLEEADANASGGTQPAPIDITVSDIAAINDYLYGSGNPLPNCE